MTLHVIQEDDHVSLWLDCDDEKSGVIIGTGPTREVAFEDAAKFVSGLAFKLKALAPSRPSETYDISDL